jgi:hypothetical protein
MKHLAHCNGDLVAVVEKDRCGHWLIFWPRRGWSKERIDSPDAAKTWVAKVLHGKLVTWMETK